MRYLLFISTVILTTTSTFAADFVSSPFYFVLGADDVQKLLNEDFEQNVEYNMDEFEMTEPFRTLASQLKVQARVHAKLKSSGLYTAAFELNIHDFRMDISALKTDDISTHQLGGLNLDINIQGDCKDVVVKQEGHSMAAAGEISINQRGRVLNSGVLINDLKLADEWVVEAGECRGPAQYQEGVRQGLEEFVKNKQQVLLFLQRELTSLLNEKLLNAAKELLSTRKMKLLNSVSVKMQPKSISLNPLGGIEISGSVSSEGSEIHREPLKIDFQLSEDIRNNNKTGFYISKDFVAAINRQMYDTGVYDMSFNSQSLEALRSFQANPFMKLFVLPDFFRFKKTDDIVVRNSLTSAPKINFVGNDNGYFWLGLNSDLDVRVLAPLKNQLQPYLKLQSPVSGYAWLKVQDNKVYLGLNSPRISSKFEWEKSYVNAYRPNQYINQKLVMSQLKKSVSTLRRSFELPEINALEGLRLQPEKLEQTEESIFLKYNLVDVDVLSK